MTNLQVTITHNTENGGESQTIDLDGMLFAGRVDGNDYSSAGIVGSMDSADMKNLMTAMLMAIYNISDQPVSATFIGLETLSTFTGKLLKEDGLDAVERKEISFLENELEVLTKRLILRLATAGVTGGSHDER